MEEPSDDTPSVTPFGRASSLREGAGNGCVPFIVPPGKRKIAGDFHRPYEGRVPFNRVLAEIRGWRAIFIAPTKLRKFYRFPPGERYRVGQGTHRIGTRPVRN